MDEINASSPCADGVKGENTPDAVEPITKKSGFYDDDLYDDDENEKFEESQRPDAPVLFEISYRIPLETYARFEEYYSVERIKRDKKSKATIGSLQVALAIFYAYMMFKGAVRLDAFNIMFVLMFLGLGTYSMLYFRYFYEKKKKFAVEKYYNTNEYFKTDICLSIYETCFVERAAEKDTVYYWHRTKGVRELSDCFHLLVAERRIILVPKPEDEDKALELRGALLDACDRFEKEWLTA